MNKENRYPPKVRERSVRMVFEHEREYSSQWAALNSIASKMGCTAETFDGLYKTEVIRQQGPWRNIEFYQQLEGSAMTA